MLAARRSYQLPAKLSGGFGTKIEEGKKLSVDPPLDTANSCLPVQNKMHPSRIH